MAKCQICGKGERSGNNVSHSNRKTRTVWIPNIQKATIVLNGQLKHVKACTRCLRSQYKSTSAA